MDRALQTCQEMLTDRGYSCVNPFYYRKQDDDIHVVCFSGKLSVQNLQEKILSFKHVLLITDNITTSASKMFQSNQHTIIEHFLTKELQYNITKHVFYSPHKKCETDIPKQHLPILFASDPVSRYFFFQPGDVIEIDRGYTKYYRIVCNK